MTPCRNPADRPRCLHFITFCRVVVLVSTLSCGGSDTTAPYESTVSVTPTSTLRVGVGETLPFIARVTDASGATLPTSVEWSTDNPAVGTVSAGGVVTAVATGVTRVIATAGSISGSALLEVWVPPEVERYEPRQTHLGRASYAGYVVGEPPDRHQCTPRRADDA